MKRFIICFHLILCISIALCSGLPLFATMNLTGSFNNWDPADTNFQMAQKNEKEYEIVKLFFKGSITFKFNADKNWDINFGAGKKNSLLEKKGKDITFFIPEDGYYRFKIDIDKLKYLITEVPPLDPLPIIKHKKINFVNESIQLDASESLIRTGAKVRSYIWKQPKQNPDKICNCLLKNAAVVSFRLRNPGTYTFYLSIDDGVQSLPRSIQFDVVNKYSLSGDKPFSRSIVEYKGKGIYEWILFSGQTYDHNLTLVRNDKEPVYKSIPLKMLKGQYYLFSYNEPDGQYSIRKESYAEFQFNPDEYPEFKDKKIDQVAVAGAFNGWDPSKDPLTKQSNGSYLLYMRLDEGVHYYKFVVNGKNWIYDKGSQSSLKQADNYGNFNSGVRVGIDAGTFGDIVKDGINPDAVEHSSDEIKYFNMVNDRLLEVKVRVLKDDATAIDISFLDKKSRVMKLNTVHSRFGFDYYSGLIDLSKNFYKLKYYFIIRDKDQKVYLSVKGIQKEKPQEKDFFEADRTVLFPTPDWAKGVFWYQIMIDRFYNGNRKNDPSCVIPWRWDWYKQYKCEEWKQDKFNDKIDGFYGHKGVWSRFYGGDLQGLIKKLDYLKELGVGAIYLNPVFESISHHKYDATDYRHIDDNFGYKGDNKDLNETEDPKTWKWTKTDKLFLKFIQKAHSKGLKVIIDGVFNHAGDHFWAFQDLKKNKENSAYKDWFVVTKWDPFQYEGWAGFSGLPVFKEDENGLVAGVSEHIFNITRRWMDPNKDGDPSDGIDGWRLDVPNEVDQAFWKKWRKLVKSINRNAYITGEIWGKAGAWLKGDQFDAVMNYEFTKRVYRFFIDKSKDFRMSPTEFDRSIKEMLMDHPMQVNLVMQNLMDSHDTDRILSGIMNPDRDFDSKNRLQEGDKYKESVPDERTILIYKLIQLFQFTLPGAPMVYYGDEVGMWGSDDPNNRLPMWWDELMPYDNPKYLINWELHKHIKKLSALRNKYETLRLGSYSSLIADDEKNVYGFQRSLGLENIYVIINNSPVSRKIELELKEKKLMDLLTGLRYAPEKGKYTIDLKPMYGVILK
ncbi:MAG: alpha amylase N-terminal ig-like domain-containing protein [Spirochaetes bacterium]|nr:alpha amylase N-terminal ig-like domain-containing protein [Spirochaetota bacterium]